jgi:hypothetical protein
MLRALTETLRDAIEEAIAEINRAERAAQGAFDAVLRARESVEKLEKLAAVDNTDLHFVLGNLELPFVLDAVKHGRDALAYASFALSREGLDTDRLRADAEARLRYADALEAWSKNR